MVVAGKMWPLAPAVDPWLNEDLVQANQFFQRRAKSLSSLNYLEPDPILYHHDDPWTSQQQRRARSAMDLQTFDPYDHSLIVPRARSAMDLHRPSIPWTTSSIRNNPYFRFGQGSVAAKLDESYGKGLDVASTSQFLSEHVANGSMSRKTARKFLSMLQSPENVQPQPGTDASYMETLLDNYLDTELTQLKSRVRSLSLDGLHQSYQGSLSWPSFNYSTYVQPSQPLSYRDWPPSGYSSTAMPQSSHFWPPNYPGSSSLWPRQGLNEGWWDSRNVHCNALHGPGYSSKPYNSYNPSFSSHPTRDFTSSTLPRSFQFSQYNNSRPDNRNLAYQYNNSEPFWRCNYTNPMDNWNSESFANPRQLHTTSRYSNTIMPHERSGFLYRENPVVSNYTQSYQRVVPWTRYSTQNRPIQQQEQPQQYTSSSYPSYYSQQHWSNNQFLNPVSSSGSRYQGDPFWSQWNDRSSAFNVNSTTMPRSRQRDHYPYQTDFWGGNPTNLDYQRNKPSSSTWNPTSQNYVQDYGLNNPEIRVNDVIIEEGNLNPHQYNQGFQNSYNPLPHNRSQYNGPYWTKSNHLQGSRNSYDEVMNHLMPRISDGLDFMPVGYGVLDNAQNPRHKWGGSTTTGDHNSLRHLLRLNLNEPPTKASTAWQTNPNRTSKHRRKRRSTKFEDPFLNKIMSESR